MVLARRSRTVARNSASGVLSTAEAVCTAAAHSRNGTIRASGSTDSRFIVSGWAARSTYSWTATRPYSGLPAES